MNRQSFQPIRLADYRPPDFLVDELFLTFRLKERGTVVQARSTIRRNPAAGNHDEPLRLAGEQLELVDLLLDDRPWAPQDVSITDQELVIAHVPDEFSLQVTTRINPEDNTALSGLYRSSGMYCTQCEAEGFRRITYFLDRPDVLARYTTRIEAASEGCPVLLANGNLVAAGTMDDGYHFAQWQDPFPKPSYLFALVAGDLVTIEDEFITASGRCVALQIYVHERNRDRCGHAMTSLKKAMQWDERVYGLEYDLDRYMVVAVDDFNMGAMENKGLNVFNAKYVLADPRSATDRDYLAIEGVIAHEYFHNWTGNRVTCRDWFQLSLKEGLTVFRDQQFSADMHSAAVQRIEDVRVLRQFQFREDAGPMAHPVRPDQYLEINNFYTVTIYNKGAEVVRMLHTLLGPREFRRGMDLYFQRHDGQAVTCDDFVAAMADASGRDLAQFKRWYVQAGTPRLTVAEQWDERQHRYVVTVAQETPATPGQPDKEPLHLPLLVGLLDGSGADLAARVSCPYERRGSDLLLELQEEQQHFVFQDVPQKPVLSFLRGFSAPVNVNPFQSRAQKAFVMQHDSDLFNRWDAAFSLAEAVILECLETLVAGGTMMLDPVYLEAMRSLVEQPADDRSLTALALQLPAENHLLQALKVIDPAALHAAHRFVKRELADRLADELLLLYRDNEPSAAYRLTEEQIGKRSLRTVSLDYLAVLGEQRAELLELCAKQYRQSATMTEKIGALSALVQVAGALRDEIVEHFENEWRSDPLVMDKWFALQAASPAGDTYDRVKKLLGHPSFSLKNPNKVRSLLGAFGQNHVHFHHESGRGYRLLADLILELDPLNSQLAARLVQPFVTWRRYTRDRRQMMQGILEEIGGKKEVSRDVYEIVSKSLAERPND